MRGGLLLSGEAVAVKQWLSLDDQVKLLTDRGLAIPDEVSCRAKLRRVGYYHLSGYGRLFQVAPAEGDNRYKSGAFFDQISGLQELDAHLRQLCLRALAAVELALRSGFGHRFGEIMGAYGALLNSNSFHAAGSKSTAIDQLVRTDLDRSRQPFVVRHRVGPGNYPSLPTWIAVEALSFGTLSKAIQYCREAAVARALADEFNLGHKGFSSQIRSFVALRNSCAHLSRLWNDVAKNPPQVPNNMIRRAKKRIGNFHPQSYYHVFVALDMFCSGVDPAARFLDQVDELMLGSQVFKEGLLNPTRY
jgi:abortive infection bacteriophage resistance protein